jgi:hypothetical protein
MVRDARQELGVERDARRLHAEVIEPADRLRREDPTRRRFLLLRGHFCPSLVRKYCLMQPYAFPNSSVLSTTR